MTDHPGTLSSEFKRRRATSGCLATRQVHMHEETVLGSSDTSFQNSTFSIHQTGDTLHGRSSIIRERNKERTGISTYSYSAKCNLHSLLVGQLILIYPPQDRSQRHVLVVKETSVQ